MNNFVLRTISGAVFAAVVIGLTYYSAISLFGLVLFIGSIGVYEFLKLQQAQNTPKTIFAIVLNVLLLFIAFAKSTEQHYFIFAFGGVALVFVTTALLRYAKQAYEQISAVMFSTVYISLPLTLFYAYANSDAYDFKKPLLVFLLVWSSDTFAYLTGRSFGKNALSPELSPKKTWEGFAGGTILTGIAGGIIAYYWHFFDIPQGVILGISVSVFGTAGDLFESSLKRNAGVKDSGNIIPGHGGILDRFDAFLFVAVVVYIFSLL